MNRGNHNADLSSSSTEGVSSDSDEPPLLSDDQSKLLEDIEKAATKYKSKLIETALYSAACEDDQFDYSASPIMLQNFRILGNRKITRIELIRMACAIESGKLTVPDQVKIVVLNCRKQLNFRSRNF